MKLNYHDWLDWVRSMTKTRQDNDLTDCIGVVYTKNEIELLWLIGQGVVCDKN